MPPRNPINGDLAGMSWPIRPSFDLLPPWRTCQWLNGDPRKRNFCDEPSRPGSSWCPEHYLRVHEGAGSPVSQIKDSLPRQLAGVKHERESNQKRLCGFQPINWTEAMLAALREGYKAGRLCREIAADISVSADVVRKKAKQLGLSITVKKRPPHNSKGWSNSEIEILRQGYKSGRRCADLARDIGVGESLIRRKARAIGLVRPPVTYAVNKRVWSDADLATLRHGYQSGDRCVDLAIAIGVNENTIRRKARAIGLVRG